MTSWVYIFSKFTPEALLFEVLAISILCACYAAFWVLRKRKLGAFETTVPTGVVKTYLNELILDAEDLRAQMFGLLAANDVTRTPRTATTVVTAADPALASKLMTLEAKLAEQTSAMQSIVQEKEKIETELAEAKAAGTKAASAGSEEPVDQGLVAELQKKIKILESKLAEYSVIEDDLANLKRLQQENAQLKASLANGGASAGNKPASPEPVAPQTAAPAAVATPVPAPAPEPVPVTAAPTPEPEPASSGPLSQADTDALFEGLVDQVEESLQEPTPSAPTAAPTPAPTVAAAPSPTPAPAAPAAPAKTEPSTPPASAGKMDKSDADLVAEFEKMLNG